MTTIIDEFEKNKIKTIEITNNTDDDTDDDTDDEIIIDINIALKFLEKNKDIILIPNEKREIYEIDKNKVNNLINNILNSSCLDNKCVKYSLLFIIRLIEIYKYVNFNEYIEQINKVCDEIKEFLKNNYEKYEKIYFIAIMDITKSNTWIMFLFLYYLKDFINEHLNIKEKIKIISNEHIVETNSLGLIFDDMSYSGKQISNHYTNKNNNIYLSMPYISKTALDLLKQKSFNVLYWNNMIIIPKLSDLFENDNTNFWNYEDFNNEDVKKLFENIQKFSVSDKKEVYKKLFKNFCMINKRKQIFYNGFQCEETLIPIYFDHKIADYISTFQKLLNFSTYPIKTTSDCVPICNNFSLISNCEVEIPNFYLDNEKNLCNTIIQRDIPDDYTCPKTYYKTIKYEFPDNLSYNGNDKYEFLTICKYMKNYKDQIES